MTCERIHNGALLRMNAARLVGFEILWELIFDAEEWFLIQGRRIIPFSDDFISRNDYAPAPGTETMRAQRNLCGACDEFFADLFFVSRGVVHEY